ncbi:thioredoxin-like protein [Aspergillus pseudonomiae]|nr:thioredoxin-like protein [Aspergillus pseudonomiae]
MLTECPASPGKGAEYSLSSTKGKVVLVVSTASKCSFTPQYQGLEDIYRPSGNTFCQLKYGVTFPALAKINLTVNKWQKRGFLGCCRITWNLTKFAIKHHGKVRSRWSPMTKPENLEKYLIQLLEGR